MESGSDYINLLSRLQNGDEAAFGYFYKKYRRWLMVVAVNILQSEPEAEELVQDFFIDFWHSELFRKLPVASAEAAENYLFISIRNRSINRLAKNDTRRKRLQNWMPDAVTMPAAKMENQELSAQLLSAISKLPEKQGYVFQSAYLMEKSRKEIALEMNISEKTVKKQMQLALRSLRGFLKNIQVFLLLII